MIVRDQQHVDVGHVIGRVRRGPWKCHVGPRERPGVGAEHWIDQNAFAVQLHEVGGMAQPDDYIAVLRQGLEIDVDRRKGYGRLEVGIAVEQHRDHVGHEARVLGAHRRVDEVLEFAVHIVWGMLNRLKVRAFRQGSKLRML